MKDFKTDILCRYYEYYIFNKWFRFRFDKHVNFFEINDDQQEEMIYLFDLGRSEAIKFYKL